MTLQGDTVTCSELARRLGCSDQTVMNYAREGMPVAGKDRRGRFYVEAECRAWIEQHKPGFKGDYGRGGKREGAGRKAVGKVDEEREAERKAVEAEAAASGAAMFGDEARRRVILREIEEGVRAEELTLRYSIGPTFAAAIREMLMVEKLAIDLRKIKGELLAKDDVEAVWTDTLTKVDQVLTSLASTLAAELAAVLSLDARAQDRVRVMVENGVERARALMRG